MNKRAQRAKLRRAAMMVHRLVRPAENRYVSGLRAVMRNVAAEYARALAPHVADFARTDADDVKPKFKGPKEASFAEVRHYNAPDRPASVSVFRFKAQENFIKSAGPRGQEFAEQLLRTSRPITVAHTSPPEKIGVTYTAEKRGEKWVHLTDVPELGAKAGEPVAILQAQLAHPKTPAAPTPRPSGSPSLVANELDALGVKIQASLAPSVGPLFDRMATSVRVANKKGQALFGIKSSDMGIDGQIRAARDASIRLVEKAHRSYAADVRAIFDDPNNHALRVEELQAMLQERADVSESRAELIARDQTLKLNGAITQTRQTNAGVSSYVWSTSLDDRVREEHAALEGQTFAWTSPPEPGHPGEDFQCRCTAIPVNDDLDAVFGGQIESVALPDDYFTKT